MSASACTGSLPGLFSKLAAKMDLCDERRLKMEVGEYWRQPLLSTGESQELNLALLRGGLRRWFNRIDFVPCDAAVNNVITCLPAAAPPPQLTPLKTRTLFVCKYKTVSI